MTIAIVIPTIARTASFPRGFSAENLFFSSSLRISLFSASLRSLFPILNPYFPVTTRAEGIRFLRFFSFTSFTSFTSSTSIHKLFSFATSLTVSARNFPGATSSTNGPNCTRLIFSTRNPTL
jgi:hypothetical protein